MKKGDRQVGNEWIYLGVLQRIGFDQLCWKDDGLRWRGAARQRIPAVSTANAMVETVCFWLLQRVGVRPDFALPLYWSGCCFEYLEWAGAAPCSEPGQVREEAAIRDRWRAPLPIRDTLILSASGRQNGLTLRRALASPACRPANMRRCGARWRRTLPFVRCAARIGVRLAARRGNFGASVRLADFAGPARAFSRFARIVRPAGTRSRSVRTVNLQ